MENSDNNRCMGWAINITKAFFENNTNSTDTFDTVNKFIQEIYNKLILLRKNAYTPTIEKAIEITIAFFSNSAHNNVQEEKVVEFIEQIYNQLETLQPIKKR